MFSVDVSESSRIVEMTFIAGVQYDELKAASSELLKFQNISLKPEVLFSFPDSKGIIYNSVLDFVFPTKINITYLEEKPKFYSIVLTNEKGMRTYCYIMKMFEKINVSSLISDEPFDRSNNLFSSPTTARNLFTNLNIESDEEKKAQDETDSKISVSYHGKAIYVPYAFCIWSTVSNIEFFKGIMNEVSKIICYDSCNLLDETIRNYRHSELLHLMIFLSNIIKPPSNVKMNINLRFSTLDFISSSVFQIPQAEQHIKLLFDTLEISSIIKLWCSILSEKHNFLLYSITEALMNLIFPFKWLHTYIPVLPQDQLDYLESPTPYIMGVLSSYTDLEYLKDCFPNHIICDVNTSIVHGNAYCVLPNKEESKLRKKIQYARNPQIYNIEDIEEFNMKNCEYLSIEDVVFTRSFSENIQYIFLRVFRNSLSNVKNKYIKDGVFESQKFLEEFNDPSLKDFWDKIINTAAFEFFIINFQYLDDSLSNIFKNVCKCSDLKNEEIANKSDVFNFSLTFPNSIDLIFYQCKGNNDNNFKNMNVDKIISDYNKTFVTIISDKEVSMLKTDNDKFRSTFISLQSGGKINFGNTSYNPGNINSSPYRKDNSIKKRDKLNDGVKKRRINNLSCDFMNLKKLKIDDKFLIPHFIKESLDITTTAKHFRRTSNYETEGFKLNPCKLNSNLNLNTISLALGIIKRRNSQFSIYGFRGFLKFADQMILHDNEHGYHFELLRIVMKHITRNSDSNELIESDFSDIEENENEEDYSSSVINCSSNFEKQHFNDIIEIPKSESVQYYLLLAFYLDDYSQSNDYILDLFKKALIKDKHSFPKIRFMQFLFNFSLLELKNISKEIDQDTSTSTTNNKQFDLIKKIVKFRLGVLEGNKRKKDHTIFIRRNKKIKKANSIKSKNESRSDDNINEHKSSNRVSIISNSEYEDDRMHNNYFEDIDEKHKSALSRLASQKNLKLLMMTGTRKSSVHLLFNSRASFCGDIYDNKADANKIIDGLKTIESKENLIVKKYLINSSSNYNSKSSKDPLAVSEDIAVRIFSLILKHALNKYKSEMFSPSLFSSISNTAEFLEIKNLIGDLKLVKLSKLSNDIMKTCFWLNLYNFLCIFTLIYKREVPTNYYEWYCFLKNSYFDVGGYELSLYEIENCILKNKVICLNNYGAIPSFNQEDTRKVVVINNIPKNTNYGVSLPTNSGPELKIYFPNNLLDLLKYNAIEFFTKNVKVDVDNFLIYVPEYINWVDSKFIENIMNYQE